jgi:hypothetical protein
MQESATIRAVGGSESITFTEVQDGQITVLLESPTVRDLTFTAPVDWWQSIASGMSIDAPEGQESFVFESGAGVTNVRCVSRRWSGNFNTEDISVAVARAIGPNSL